MVIQDFRKLIQCKDRYLLSKNRLKDRDDRKAFIYSVLNGIRSRNVKTEKDLRRAFKDYPDSFSTDFEKEIFFEKDFRVLQRLLCFLSEQPEVIASDTPFIFTPDYDFTVKGETITGISGCADFILKDSAGYRALIITPSKLSCSYRARKAENKVENDITLIISKLGLEKVYPNLRITLYSLSGKDDRGTDIKPNKDGINYVTTGFDEYYSDGFLDRDALTEKLLRLSEAESRDCESCMDRDICKIGNFRVDVPVSKEIIKKKVTPTPSQSKVINHIYGPMAVIAVPGAGKTQCLVERLRNLVALGINPESILFLTFARKAAEEIRERVKAVLPKDSPLPHVTTIHGMANMILREQSDVIGRHRLAKDTDLLKILHDVVRHSDKIEGVSYEGITLKFGLLNRLLNWFTEIDDVGFDMFSKTHEKLDLKGIKAVYDSYKKVLLSNGIMTFDEEVKAAGILLEDEKIRSLYQARFKFLMVDEYQDIDDIEEKLIRLLSSENITVVGDDDQSIYRFRNASNKHLLRFSETHDNAVRVVFPDNFRSNDAIINASKELIKNNKNRLGKEFRANRQASKKPVLLEHAGIQDVVHMVKTFLKFYAPGDIAVISRKNKVLDEISELLAAEKIDVSSPKDYIIRDEVFLTLLALLRTILSTPSDKDLYRLLYHEGLPVPKGTASLYERLSMSGALDFKGKTDLNSPYAALSKKLRRAYLLSSSFSGDFSAYLTEILCLMSELTAHPVISFLCDLSGTENITTLNEILSEMETLLTYNATDRAGYCNNNYVNLLTAHDSKGKEFPVVIIYPLEDFTGETDEEIEEERRLLFVAMTRAKDNLVMLSSPTGRFSFLPEIKPSVTTVSL